jgi:hypothetical protein
MKFKLFHFLISNNWELIHDVCGVRLQPVATLSSLSNRIHTAAWTETMAIASRYFFIISKLA